MSEQMILEGERLVLRDFREDDFGAVHAYGTDLEVVRYLPWGPNEESDTRAFLSRARESSHDDPRTDFELAVVEWSGGRLIGGIGLHCRDAQAMLGYCYDRRAWGKGYATEAGRLLLDFGFRVLKLHRVWAGCDPENVGSIRVLEKLGMRREGLLKEETLIRGEWRDTLLFAVLEREWRGRAVGADKEAER